MPGVILCCRVVIISLATRKRPESIHPHCASICISWDSCSAQLSCFQPCLLSIPRVLRSVPESGESAIKRVRTVIYTTVTPTCKSWVPPPQRRECLADIDCCWVVAWLESYHREANVIKMHECLFFSEHWRTKKKKKKSPCYIGKMSMRSIT